MNAEINLVIYITCNNCRTTWRNSSRVPRAEVQKPTADHDPLLSNRGTIWVLMYSSRRVSATINTRFTAARSHMCVHVYTRLRVYVRVKSWPAWVHRKRVALCCPHGLGMHENRIAFDRTCAYFSVWVLVHNRQRHPPVLVHTTEFMFVSVLDGCGISGRAYIIMLI